MCYQRGREQVEKMGDEEGGVWGHAFKSGGPPPPPPSPTPLVIIDIVEYLWCLILIRISYIVYVNIEE